MVVEIFYPFKKIDWLLNQLNNDYSLYILYTSPYSDMWFANFFSQSINGLFILLSVFCMNNTFNFNEVQFIKASYSTKTKLERWLTSLEAA